ncbi:MAG: PKD domain-containing protein [Bacteroidales bacterium]|nr:PKD domain-containing protein [Bacteroidales bacterium]
MKKLLLPIFMLMLILPVMAQQIVSIHGTVTDIATGNPINNQAVVIMNDSSSGWFYYQTVYTNSNGYYYDSIPIPPAGAGILYVQTIDCQNYLHQQVITYNPTHLNFTVDFAICHSNTPCQANFSFLQQVPLTVQFNDASVGGGNLRQWNFGDGMTSTLMNPSHTFTGPGLYIVTLSIGAPGTTCYNTMSQSVYVWDSTGGGCQAAFVIIPDSMNTVNTFHFINQSSGNIHTWTWNFGDGHSQTITTPANPNVLHTYAQNGAYYVCLTIHGADSSCYDVTCDTLIVGIPPTCHAGFTYYNDSVALSNLVHFIDQSTGNITNWSWNFGDGGTSNEQNPLHNYAVPGNYHVTLTVSSPAQWCYDSVTHLIVVGTNPGCQANFSYGANPSTGNHTIHFTDLSTGNPTAWFWSFGDGTSGSTQNPVHTYGSPGSYVVCLTITGNNCTSTYCKNVVVSDSINYHNIYGQVFAGNFPLSIGFAMIFSLDTNANFQPFVDVFPIDSNGVYYFTMVPDGHYYIMAIPVNPTGYLPTYYGNTINWEQATLITLGTPNNPYNINLVASDQLTPGPGSVSGQINMGDMVSSLVDKVNIILMNEQGTPVGFTKVAASGAFSFPSMAYGTYYLHPEMPGVTSDQIKVILTPDTPQAVVVMTFSGNSILGIRAETSPVTQCSVYPNPVTDHVAVSLDMKQGMQVFAEIQNLAGQLMSRTPVSLVIGSNMISISTFSLPAGIYTLRIFSNDGVNLHTKLLKTR